MKNIRVTAKFPLVGPGAQAGIAFLAFLTAYYRQPLLFLFFVLLLCYLTWSYLWALLSCRYTGVESELAAGKCFAGGTFAWELVFTSNLPFPLARCGVDFLLQQGLSCSGNVPLESAPAPMKKENSDRLRYVLPAWRRFTAYYPWLTGGEKHRVQLEIKAPRRGVYYLPPPHFFAGDPSGLFQGRFLSGEEKFLTVFPRLKSSAEILEILSPQESGKEYRTGLEDYYHIQGIKDYQQSDSPRSINWYATARTGNLKANLYQRQAAKYCLVAFDLSAAGQPVYGEQSGRQADPPLEEAISLAAGIALFSLEKGINTAFLTNAPLLRWVKGKAAPDSAETFLLEKCGGISDTGFACSVEHARRILELCTTIDETSRARPAEQQELWNKIEQAPSHCLIYLLRYHCPPANWDLKSIGSVTTAADPLNFYTPQLLRRLAAARLMQFNLSSTGEARQQ